MIEGMRWRGKKMVRWIGWLVFALVEKVGIRELKTVMMDDGIRFGYVKKEVVVRLVGREAKKKDAL